MTLSQTEWMQRYRNYMSAFIPSPYERDVMALAAWEAWPDDDPEEIASSDLHCMRGEA